jgi:hypothetical protein
MDQEILKQLDELKTRVDTLYATLAKIKKYFTIAVVIYALLFILPLIGLLIAVPYYLNTLNTALSF